MHCNHAAALCNYCWSDLKKENRNAICLTDFLSVCPHVKHADISFEADGSSVNVVRYL